MRLGRGRGAARIENGAERGTKLHYGGDAIGERLRDLDIDPTQRISSCRERSRALRRSRIMLPHRFLEKRVSLRHLCGPHRTNCCKFRGRTRLCGAAAELSSSVARLARELCRAQRSFKQGRAGEYV